MKRTEQKVIRFISENNLLKKGEKVLIALSGGPDSIFLLHFLNKFKKKYKIEIEAVHINHSLRGPSSDRDELFCRTICNELNIPIYFIIKNVKSLAKKNKLSIEVAARKTRYEFFNLVLKKSKLDKILTAHNADDNVETVLLNLIKGAGLKGIAGIPVKRQNIIRPILCLSKKEILEYLEENKFEYRIDESNLKNDFERNYLRNKIVPLLTERLNPSLSNSVLTTSLNLQSLVEEIEFETEKLKSTIKIEKSNVIKLPIKKIDENPIAKYLVKQSVDELFGVKLESNDLNKIFSLKKKETGKSEELTNKLIAQKDRNEIFIQKKNHSSINIKSRKIIIGKPLKIGDREIVINKIDLKEIKFSNSKNIEYISADNLKPNFIVRNWEDGDKFYPIGMKGTKKVSDYLNDIKISSFEKKNQLILECGGKIIWIMGQRLDDRFKIKSNTKKVLKLCLN